MHWMDVARRGLRLARRRSRTAGATGDCAVAFSLNGDVDTPEGLDTIELLARLFDEEPPDLILLETLVAGARLDLRDGRGAARDGPARVAELPPLPPRRLRRLRPALGRPGGRRVRARRAPLRGAGRRRAARQLHPARPRRGHRAVAARLHRPAARRLPQPRLPVRRTAGASRPASAARSSPRWRCAGARRARRSSAAAAASGRSTSAPRGARSKARCPAAGAAGPASRSPPTTSGRHAPRAPRWTDERGRDLFPLPFPDLDLRARRVRADAGQLPRLAPPVPRRHRARQALPRHRLRAPAC